MVSGMRNIGEVTDGWKREKTQSKRNYRCTGHDAYRDRYCDRADGSGVLFESGRVHDPLPDHIFTCGNLEPGDRKS